MNRKITKHKRPLSFFLALLMMFSGMGGASFVTADEAETDVFPVTEDYPDAENMGDSSGEEVSTKEEPSLYELVLPYYEGCIYDYDRTHEVITDEVNVNDVKRDIFLNYQKDEEVKLMIFFAEQIEIKELHLYSKDRKEPAFMWSQETGKLDFFMPENDLRLELYLTEHTMEQTNDGFLQDTAMEEAMIYQGGDSAADHDANYATTEKTDIYPSESSGDTILPETQTGMGEQVPAEDAEIRETEAYEIVIEADGLPSQGSIDQMETMMIPFDTWDFDPVNDFTNITYHPDEYEITYISDDIVYDQPGTYNSIYRIQQKKTERMWYVLRPVRVAEPSEIVNRQKKNNEEMAFSAEISEEAGTEVDAQIVSSDPESQSDLQLETDLLYESESETETDTEIETESAENGEHQVTIVNDAGYPVELSHEDGMYHAGEVVEFTTALPSSSLKAAAALHVEANEQNKTEDILYSEISYDAAKDSFSFRMPEDDVKLSVIEDFISEESILYQASGDEEDLPWDEASDIEANSYYYYSDEKTHPFSGVMGSGGNDSYKYIRYKVDGKKYTAYAYCLQHSKPAPPSGTTYKKMIDLDEGGDDKYLRKALFYGYGGPGWNKTIGGYNIKSIMEDYGCPSGQMRAMQHYLVDYLYDGESGYGGSLSDKAKNMLKAMKAALKKMPDPSDMELLPSLSTTASGMETESFTWKADAAWVITIALEDGVSLVNETTGAVQTGNVKVKGGETFHLSTTPDRSGTLDGHYRITSNLPLNFHGMLLKLSNSQDIGFGYYTDDMGINLTVKWPSHSSVTVEKHDAVTGSIIATPGYSMDGAVYGIFSDPGCNSLIEQMTIYNGSAVSAPYAVGSTYYVKEIFPAKGYALDPDIHCVAIQPDSANNIVISIEKPKGVNIHILKMDANTGSAAAVSAAYSMAGAEYTVFLDEGCQNAVETIVIGSDHTGVSQKEYLVGTYYVKETKAPSSGLYQMDPQVYPVTVSLDQAESGLPVSVMSTESPKTGKISIQKINETYGTQEPYTKALPFTGAVFGIYSDSSCREELLIQTITTDETGYAESTDLYVGDYWIKEITAPAGYTVRPEIIKVSAREMSEQIARTDGYCRYNIEEKVIRGDVSLMKYLADGSDEEQKNYMEMVENGELSGITFTFHYLDADDVADVVLTTDPAGRCGTENGALIYGTWEIRESGTPKGYEGLKDGTTITISKQDEAYSYVVYNGRIQAQVRIVKKDAETGNVIPLSGAKFRILDAEGLAVRMYDTVTDEISDILTTNSNGMIFLTARLPMGTYTLEEIQAPEGYLPAAPITFTVDKNYSAEEPLEVVAEDIVQKGQVQITKIDTQTGARLGAGFRFEVRVGEQDITDPAGTARTIEINGKSQTLTPGTLLETIETDDSGIAKSSLLPLGSYVIREVQAAEYYAVADSEYPVTISYDGDTETVLADLPVKNRKTTLDLYKINADQEEEALSGITFRIFSSADQDAEKARQIAEAVEALRIEQQKAAAAAKETAATELGLLIRQCDKELDDIRKSDPTQANQKEAENEEKIRTLMANQKKEAETLARVHSKEVQTMEEQMAAELEITDFLALGETFVTDEKGQIHKEDLLHATTYYIYETETLPGFNLDTTIHEFTVDEKGLIDGKDHYEIRIANTPNHVLISKKSITGMEELPGAELEVRSVNEDGTETVIESWTSTEEPHLISALPSGNYTLTEVTAPKGYAIAQTIAFTVTDSLEIAQVEMIDELLEIYISKKDITNDEELPGASLSITDAEGTVVEEWISGQEPYRIQLPAGEYLLTEIAAPDGYLVANTIPFTVDAAMAVQTVTMYDIPEAEVNISKKDITNEEELPGAELTVTDQEGTVIDTWISETVPHVLKLKPGRYTLTEKTAPENYQCAESILFEIGEEDYKAVQTVTMYDAPIPTVRISKKDITNDEELPGAKLVVKDKDGNTVEEWISQEEPHEMILDKGEYTLTEITAPQGYEVSETIRFEVTDSTEVQHVTMYDAPKEELVDLTGMKKEISNGSEPSGSSGGNMTSAPVKTGDSDRYLPAVLLLAAGACTMAALLITRKRKRKQ